MPKRLPRTARVFNTTASTMIIVTPLAEPIAAVWTAVLVVAVAVEDCRLVEVVEELPLRTAADNQSRMVQYIGITSLDLGI